MTRSTNHLGRSGEEVALRHLQGLGFRILERNWRAVAGDVRGEVDVIAQDGGVTVFCEVKTRRGTAAEAAFAAVTACKRRQLRRLAAVYLSRRRDGADVRFDVVAVAWPPAGPPAVEHIRGAF